MLKGTTWLMRPGSAFILGALCGACFAAIALHFREEPRDAGANRLLEDVEERMRELEDRIKTEVDL